MIDWAEVNEKGDLVIDWNEVFDNSQDYDHGLKTYGTSLAKIIALVQKDAFEKGFLAGMDAKHPEQRLLAYTGGHS